jgi:hypothetical protein
MLQCSMQWVSEFRHPALMRVRVSVMLGVMLSCASPWTCVRIKRGAYSKLVCLSAPLLCFSFPLPSTFEVAQAASQKDTLRVAAELRAESQSHALRLRSTLQV